MMTHDALLKTAILTFFTIGCLLVVGDAAQADDLYWKPTANPCTVNRAGSDDDSACTDGCKGKVCAEQYRLVEQYAADVTWYNPVTWVSPYSYWGWGADMGELKTNKKAYCVGKSGVFTNACECMHNGKPLEDISLSQMSPREDAEFIADHTNYTDDPAIPVSSMSQDSAMPYI
jgi:hypothetical protein